MGPYYICGKKLQHLRGLITFITVITFRGATPSTVVIMVNKMFGGTLTHYAHDFGGAVARCQRF